MTMIIQQWKATACYYKALVIQDDFIILLTWNSIKPVATPNSGGLHKKIERSQCVNGDNGKNLH